MELYSQTARRKIDEVNSAVRPLVDRLVQAMRISQNHLFAIYPIYFEYNRIKNELNRTVFYAEPNNERIRELQAKLLVKRNQLDQTEKRNQCDFYDLFRPLLASSDYFLMASIVAKCLHLVFQSLLENKLKERDILLRKLLATGHKQKDGLDDDRTALARLNETIDKGRISLEVIWRELALLFNHRPKDNTLIGNKFADLIFQGQPFEVLDGDNFRLNYTFLKAIFEAKQRQALRIQVISIIGPQNSGKSTLLNLMFGCDFSIDRCTRGILGSFIKATGESAKEFDYLLALDTEGLQSIEKSDREYDRQLILFAFAVSNMVIIVTKDQITEDFKTSLEICVDSLRKIEMARVHRPAVYFVMNQRADPSKRADHEAFNKMVDSFTSNGLIRHLRLGENNFETLPSAFNTDTVLINKPTDHVIRYCTTSPEFTKRVARLAKTVLDLARETAMDEAFQHISIQIVKWIEMSNSIFDLISFTYFNTTAVRKQQKE